MTGLWGRICVLCAIWYPCLEGYFTGLWREIPASVAKLLTHPVWEGTVLAN